MVTFEIVSGRYIPVSEGVSVPFFEAIYGQILDADITDSPPAIEWDAEEGHPILVGDAQPEYRMKFRRVPNIIWNWILAFQRVQDEIPGMTEPFVSIVTGTAFLINDDGTLGRQLEVGEFLTP